MIAYHGEQWNNGINNEEISSSKTLDNQNLSKEIEMENEQSYDVRNRDNTIISYHSELQRREHSNYQADTAESMDRKKSNKKKCRGVTTYFFLVRQSQWVGIICPP
jgi:hypothetical protein